jgi:hypothetical protein
LNDVTIKVGDDYVLAGSGGRLVQRNNSGIYDIFEIRVSTTYGSVLTSSDPSIIFEELFIRFTTATDELFPNPGDEMLLMDASYPMRVESVDTYFDGPDAIRMITNNYTVLGVPTPSSLMMLMLGLSIAGFGASRKVNLGA